jgi:hypothetical protein
MAKSFICILLRLYISFFNLLRGQLVTSVPVQNIIENLWKFSKQSSNDSFMVLYPNGPKL